MRRDERSALRALWSIRFACCGLDPTDLADLDRLGDLDEEWTEGIEKYRAAAYAAARNVTKINAAVRPAAPPEIPPELAEVRANGGFIEAALAAYRAATIQPSSIEIQRELRGS